jgi:hypothetical protein
MDKLLGDVLGASSPFLDGEEPSAADSDAEDHEVPTIAALKHLQDAGISLAHLLDDVIFGHDDNRGHKLVQQARRLSKSLPLTQYTNKSKRTPPVCMRYCLKCVQALNKHETSSKTQCPCAYMKF